MELNAVEAEIEKYLPFLQDAQDADQLMMTQIIRQMGRNLRGRTQSQLSLSDDNFDEDAVVTAIKAGQHAPTPECWYYIVKARLCYFWGDWPHALEMWQAAQRLIPSLLATPYVPEHVFFFHSLILAALYPQASAKTRLRLGNNCAKISGR